jgi:hypothetical protein
MEDQSIITPHNLLANLIMAQKNKEKTTPHPKYPKTPRALTLNPKP